MARRLWVGMLVAAFSWGAAGAARAVCGDAILEPAEECDDGNGLAGDCCAADCSFEAEGSTCDDGVACTAGDACELGVCRGEPGDPFCGADAEAETGLGAFACYRARPERADKGEPPLPFFEPRSAEPVLDEFGAGEAARLDVKKTQLLCVAALVGEAADPSALEGRPHLLQYAAKTSREKPRQPRFHTREMGFETGLATAGMKVKKPGALLVPSALAPGPGGVAEPAPTAPPPRFSCYQAKLRNPKKARAITPHPFEKTTLVVRDELGGEADYKVGKPTRVCLPELALAAVDAGPEMQLAYLVCHKARRTGAKPAALPAVVSTRNAFGDEVLRAERVAELCLPGLSWAPPPEGPPPFGFLAEKGPVEAALATLWRGATRASGTAAEARDAFAARLAAQEVIAAHQAEAQKELAAELRKLGSDEAGRWASLLPLLAVAGPSPAILDRLHQVLMDPRTGTSDGHDVGTQELVRQLAMEALAYQARMGSDEARALVLASAESPHPDVCASSVRHYYQLERDRRTAQRELRARLDPSMEYLLWQE